MLCFVPMTPVCLVALISVQQEREGKDFFLIKAGHDDAEYLKFEVGQLPREEEIP